MQALINHEQSLEKGTYSDSMAEANHKLFLDIWTDNMNVTFYEYCVQMFGVPFDLNDKDLFEHHTMTVNNHDNELIRITDPRECNVQLSM